MAGKLLKKEQTQKRIIQSVLAQSFVGQKKFVLRTEFTAEGKCSTVIILFHKKKRVEAYWGLDKAIEDFNKL
jgi:hypothetical protein